MIPPWLQNHNHDGTHRAAAIGLCHKCKKPVLRGLDADTLAGTAQCDPTPLTPLGEAIALLTGRHTYTLTPGQGRKELDYRDNWRIQHPTKHPILAQHKCGAIDLKPFAAPPTTTPATQPLPATPPF